ncbi:MAG: hydrogenase expression protein HupH [Gammaproteobacteria bacterium]|jgi:Asp/Glu/hydantoin racemase|nr:hydrogenase expression protein HupH [Gammaproteobacteria bacterium]
MKTISVILPINNPEMLSQSDLDAYQTLEHQLLLNTVNTTLREIKTAEEGAQVTSLVLEAIQQAEKSGTSAIVVYAFGDLAVKEGKALVSIPVMALGKAAIHTASFLCRDKFTVIPSMLAHNHFIQAMINEENLNQKFVPASYAVEESPANLKNNPIAFSKLIEAASREIVENKVDTFSLGCGGFIGMAKPLQNELRKVHNKPIVVVDPIEVSLNISNTLC